MATEKDFRVKSSIEAPTSLKVGSAEITSSGSNIVIPAGLQTTGVGVPQITSASSVTITAPDGINLNGIAVATESYVNTQVSNVDLSSYATTSYVNTQLATKVSTSSISTVALTGNYNDLLNKPTIPSLTGYATETYVDNGLALKANTSSLATVATSGDYNDLLNKPTFISSLGSIGGHTDVDISTVAPTNGQVLKWNSTSSAFEPGDAASSVSNLTDVDLTGLVNNSVLKYDSINSEWKVATDNDTANATTNAIVPFALARVASTSNGSGIGISWNNWNSGNGSFDFTFSSAQPDTNYIVITDAETFDDYHVGINSKTVNGFTAEFYDTSGVRAPSSFSPFGLIIYSSSPTQTITATAESEAKNDMFWENSTTLSQSYTITSGKNAMSAGPINIGTGVTVDIPSGSVWTIV